MMNFTRTAIENRGNTYGFVRVGGMGMKESRLMAINDGDQEDDGDDDDDDDADDPDAYVDVDREMMTMTMITE